MTPRRNFKTTPKTPPRARFVVCVNNDGYQSSLEVRKIYQALPDAKAAVLGLSRVIDESGEDYLFPSGFFVPIRLSEGLKSALSVAA